jgi:hypothetical protein
MADLIGPKETPFTFAHLDADIVKTATETANWQIDDFTKILGADFAEAAAGLPLVWDASALPVPIDPDPFAGMFGDYDGNSDGK